MTPAMLPASFCPQAVVNAGYRAKKTSTTISVNRRFGHDMTGAPSKVGYQPVGYERLLLLSITFTFDADPCQAIFPDFPNLRYRRRGRRRKVDCRARLS